VPAVTVPPTPPVVVLGLLPPPAIVCEGPTQVVEACPFEATNVLMFLPEAPTVTE
jgi:hypothetical protein